MMTSRLTDNTASLTCRGKRAISFAVALGVALTLLVPMSAHAGTFLVSGNFTRSAVQPLTCLGIVCITSDFTGDIQGRAKVTITSLTPSTPAGVLFYTGRTVIRTTNGNLSCAESGAGNSEVPSDQEFVSLCEITGGTGVFAGASGYLQFTGTSRGGLGGTLPGVLPGSPSIADGQYQGKIIAPLLVN